MIISPRSIITALSVTVLMAGSGCVTNLGTEPSPSTRGAAPEKASKGKAESTTSRQHKGVTSAATNHAVNSHKKELKAPQQSPALTSVSGQSSSAPSHHPSISAVTRLITKAHSEAAKKHWEMASANIERAYRIAPKNPAVTHAKASILLEQTKYEQAESWSLRTLQLLYPGDKQQELAAWQIIHTCRAALHKSESAQKESIAKIEQLKGQLHNL